MLFPNGEARAGLAEEVTFEQRLAQREGVSEGLSRCPGPEVGAWCRVEACKGSRRVMSQSKEGWAGGASQGLWP